MKIILLLFVYTIFIIDAGSSSPLEDGKYRPKKFRNDGKYFRPPNEGKYVHTDDGKYFYIYQKGIYPIDDGDYRYIHVEGPRGGHGPDYAPGGRDGFGGGDGFDGSGDGDGTIGLGGFYGLPGSGGPQGPGGPFGPNGPEGPNGLDTGIPVYADKYPYIDKTVIELANRYASVNAINYGDKSEGSINYYKELKADNATAIKCRFLYPENNNTVFVHESPEEQLLKDDDYVGTYYRFSGTKCVDTVSRISQAKRKLKLHYEVFVKVIDEFTEPIDIDPIEE